MKELRKFIKDQLSVWPLAAENFRSLKKTDQRTLKAGGLEVRLQFNPCRIASTTAETDAATLAARNCFLCEEYRPAEQFHIKFEGRKGRRYNIQLNPYPIFPNHLVIARDTHTPQEIWHNLPDMLSFVERYPDFTIFYNGPFSGASAPDHLHFQACPRHLMPLENDVDAFLDRAEAIPLASLRDASIYHYPRYTTGIFALKASTSKSLSKLFYRLLECAGIPEGESEPRFNLFCYRNEEEFRCFVVMRSALRSHHYYSTGSDHLTMSPGAADMAGVWIAPHRDDFDKLDDVMLEEMLSEVSVSSEEQTRILHRLTRGNPKIDVGIMSAKSISFEIISDGAGRQKVSWKDGRIDYNGVLYDELYFDGITRSTLFAEASFILYDVTIGIDFHWQRKRDLSYAGALKFIVEGENITAINHIGVENYLLSVISSEMKAEASPELLKAHAVISRSWLLARVEDFRSGKGPHANFVVCADDHCQRYQGRSMAAGDAVKDAIDETWGLVLKSDGTLCDTRYSKCCGGRTELFSTCWEGEDKPYLRSVPDTPGASSGLHPADAFCNCSDAAVLSQVLNDYDMETRDFFEWTQRYGREELSALLKERTGIDFGVVESLEPLHRGPSGRIDSLRIDGSLRSATIGRELAIRRALSTSHLKSSAFDLSWEGDVLTIHGYGWGHGVGLCQIGAAVMASRGYSYEDILEHYYPGSKLSAAYED